MDPTPPRIGFSTGKHSPVSAIIRAATGSLVSHAYLVFYDPTLDDEYILEADVGGFQPDRYSIFKRTNNVLFELDPKVPMAEAIKAADKWIGDVGYDYEGLFSMSFVMAARWFKKRIKNPLHAPHSMYCSEAMTHALQYAGFRGADEIDPPSESPEQLLVDMLRNDAGIYFQAEGVKLPQLLAS